MSLTSIKEIPAVVSAVVRHHD